MIGMIRERTLNWKISILNALTIDIQRDINNLNDWNKGNDNAEKEGLYLLDFLV
jgi:hypothetical protein